MAEPNKNSPGRLNRRSRMKAPGVTLAGDLAASHVAPQAAAQTQSAATPRRGKDRSFLCDDEFKNTILDGRQGFQVKVRLTEYRSLPLSCITGIELKVDGESVNPGDIVFTLNNYSHKLTD